MTRRPHRHCHRGEAGARRDRVHWGPSEALSEGRSRRAAAQEDEVGAAEGR